MDPDTTDESDSDDDIDNLYKKRVVFNKSYLKREYEIKLINTEDEDDIDLLLFLCKIESNTKYDDEKYLNEEYTINSEHNYDICKDCDSKNRVGISPVLITKHIFIPMHLLDNMCYIIKQSSYEEFIKYINYPVFNNTVLKEIIFSALISLDEKEKSWYLLNKLKKPQYLYLDLFVELIRNFPYSFVKKYMEIDKVKILDDFIIPTIIDRAYYKLSHQLIDNIKQLHNDKKLHIDSILTNPKFYYSIFSRESAVKLLNIIKEYSVMFRIDIGYKLKILNIFHDMNNYYLNIKKRNIDSIISILNKNCLTFDFINKKQKNDSN
jgi:hypothetical protein